MASMIGEHHCDTKLNMQNWTEIAIKSTMLYSKAGIMEVKFIIPIIFVIGFCGNSAFFLVLARVKTMRTMTNIYLANLAAADLLVLVTTLLFRSWRYVSDPYVVWNRPFRTNAGCGVYVFVFGVSFFASMFFITLVSFDRYFAICQPLKYRSLKNKKREQYCLMFLVWCVSAVLSIPVTFAFSKLVRVCLTWPSIPKYDAFPDVGRRCYPVYPVLKDVSDVLQTVPFISALITNTILYIKIIRQLTLMKAPGENANKASEKAKQRITMTLLVNCFVFFCCISPSQFLTILNMKFLNPDALARELTKNLLLTAYILVMVNSAVNPILYGAVSPTYRRGYLKAFGLLKNRVEPSEDEVTERSTTRDNK